MVGVGDNDNSDELFLADCRVESLSNVYLNLPKLRSLNLHANYIPRIENLSSLHLLTHLDLSSNQISRIEGLRFLTNLEQLNLACNFITIVEGLTSLRSLVSINLSYNQIVSLTGFRSLPSDNSLNTVQLQGNNLTDVNHIALCLRSCLHLECLVLEDGPSASNPLCSNTNYSRILQEQLKSLKTTEKPSPEVISSSSVTSPADLSAATPATSKLSVVSTPRIDAVLDRFHKALDNKSVSPSASSINVDDSKQVCAAKEEMQHQFPVTFQDKEKNALEQQLQILEKKLLMKKIESTELELEQLQKSSPKQSPKKLQSSLKKNASRNTAGLSDGGTNGNSSSCVQVPARNKAAFKNSAGVKAGTAGARRFSDMMCRDAVNSTYQQLMKDLDTERMRRVKAEEAACQLAQQLKSHETSSNEQLLVKRNCDDAIAKLKKKFLESKDMSDKLTEEVEMLQAREKELTAELKRSTKTCLSQEKTIRDLEHVQERLEQLKVDSEAKHREESERHSKAIAEQTEYLQTAQATVKLQKAELEDLKSLLACREADHKRDLEHRYTLDSPKLEQLLQSKVANLIKEQAAERKEYESRLEMNDKEYSELEDEFRMALQIEAERFQSLKTAFEDLSSQQSVHEELLKSSKEKDIKNHKMIADLTQLVKDQKDKIVSLSKEKQEAVRKMQGTKSGLEQQIQNLNTKVTDHDRLKKDNLELKNQVQGQHSIISGLRKERELWSKELAQQGASLSNERGMLEAKLETLTQENKTLRTNLENEVDTVKIKTKLVLDLTETVSSLRQKLSLLERQLQDQGGELKTIEDQHQKEIENERNHSASLELEIENLVKRKEDLKAQLQSSENDLRQLKESHRSLKEKWQDKSFLISSLEDQVKQMKHSWQEKESKLTEERDKSIQAADLALQRLRISDDGFRKQLEAKELSHNDYIKELTEQYELQIAEKQHRVETVEDEMRELLMDQEQSKKSFDDKLKKFSDALQEFQKVRPG